MLSYKVAAYVGSGTELQRQKDRGILVSQVFEDSDSETLGQKRRTRRRKEKASVSMGTKPRLRSNLSKLTRLTNSSE